MAISPTDVNIPVLCSHLGALLQAARTEKSLYQTIVDSPFQFQLEMAKLFLGFITFVLVDEHNRVIYLGAASATEYYHRSMDGYNLDPKDYKISLDNTDNSYVQAILSGEPVATNNWDTLRRPRVHAGVARINQASGGIGYSVVHPLKGKRRGALMYNFFQEQDQIGKRQYGFMDRYTGLVNQALMQLA